jgi:predicted permease
MRVLDEARLRLRSLFRRRKVEDELDAEFRFHLDHLIEENIASGMTPDEAQTAARRAIGAITQLQEECRDMRGTQFLESVVQDVRYATRTLWKAPVFTAMVVATLGLGIGGITAVFSVVQTVLLAPLPYEQPGQLVRMYQVDPNRPASPYYVTGPHFREIRDHISSLEEVVALGNYSERGLDLVHDGQARRLRVLRVTSGYFRTLRSGRLRGREFDREHETRTRLVVLGAPLWRSNFHSDSSIIGRTIRLSAEPYVVVGVAPDGFKDPVEGDVDAWVPYDLASDRDESNHSLTLLGRLRNGVTVAQARAELAALSQTLKERWPQTDNTLIVQPLKDDLVAYSRGTLNVLSVAVALVLMVACLNVANLFLVRAIGRVREFGIRSALGSGGIRIARQLLVESILLAAAGGAVGLGLGVATLNALRSFGGHAIPRLEEVGLDPVILSVTAAVTLLTGLIFGIGPAVRFARMDPNYALHQQSRSASGDRGQGRVRSGLAILQVTFALILLVGAGVLAVSFYSLRQVHLGFRTSGVLTFELTLPSASYDESRRAAFYEQLASRIEAIPGVIKAGGISRLPATGDYHSWWTRALSGPRAGTDFRIEAQQRVINGDFISALSIPILAGRTFDQRDDASTQPRALVSAHFAQQAFPGLPLEQVVGQRIRVLVRQLEIIGVVGDVALDARGTVFPAVYQAHRQFAGNRNWGLTQVVSTQLPPEQILAAVRAAVGVLDPQLVVHRAAPLADLLGRGVARERFALVLMAAFAIVAVALAAIGLYGVLAYSVRQRTQEFGIRMAIGATAWHVRGLVLRQAAVVVGVGIALGIGGALLVGRWLSTLVYQTSPYDPRVFVATASLLMMVGLLAAWFPAWRASRIQPGIAMYEE